MAFANIALPNINGALEIGLAVGTDPTLADELKLPVLLANGATDNDVFRTMIGWAFNNATINGWGRRAQVVTMSSIAGICQAKLIRYRSGAVAGGGMRNPIPDGDWRAVTVPILPEGNSYDNGIVAEALQEDNIRSALVMIMATKANWWTMNHHIGQGQMVGYAKKSDVFLTGVGENNRAHLMNMMGHWVSTIYVLTRAGVEGLRNTEPAWGGEPAFPITFSANASLRFTSCPAGTHRMAVGYAGAKKLLRNRIAILCPQVDNLGTLADMKRTVDDNRAMCHVGAVYLTGARHPDYNDTQAEAALGRVGTFIRAFFPTTTLAQSPHLQDARVRGYEDFDIGWQNTCMQVKAAQARAGENLNAFLAEGGAGAAPEVMRRVRDQFFH
ncbi:uncharacterized protein LOC135167054 isoform X2 [Diachasmimorpha longicaudata]